MPSAPTVSQTPMNLTRASRDSLARNATALGSSGATLLSRYRSYARSTRDSSADFRMPHLRISPTRLRAV